MSQSSFPFMQIANRYKYDYGETLRLAESIRYGKGIPDELTHWVPRQIAIKNIIDAIAEGKRFKGTGNG